MRQRNDLQPKPILYITFRPEHQPKIHHLMEFISKKKKNCFLRYNINHPQKTLSSKSNKSIQLS